MIPPAQERRARGRTEGSRVEPCIPQSASREFLEVGRLAGATERGRRSEAGIVDQNDEHIRSARGRADLANWRILRVWISSIKRGQVDRCHVWNRQHVTLSHVLPVFRVIDLFSFRFHVVSPNDVGFCRPVLPPFLWFNREPLPLPTCVRDQRRHRWQRQRPPSPRDHPKIQTSTGIRC